MMDYFKIRGLLLMTLLCSFLQVNSQTPCTNSYPLGMISGSIQDWQISASSTYPSVLDEGCSERYARLYLPDTLAWCASSKSQGEWIQIDLGVETIITGMMIQGRGAANQFVTKFQLSHSLEAFNWKYVEDAYGSNKNFLGNSDPYSVRSIYLDQPIVARFLKLHVVQFHRHASLRLELLGCQQCRTLIGYPPFGRMTASSELKPLTRRSRQALGQAPGATGQLRGILQFGSMSPSGTQGGLWSGSQPSFSCSAEDGSILSNRAWCSENNDENQFLQFDVGPPTKITGVVTKGRGDTRRPQWVTRFRLSYSNDSENWQFYKEISFLPPKTNGTDLATILEGNNDKYTERYNYFNAPFIARFVRIHPHQWNRHISLRAGLLGCPYTAEDCGPGFYRVHPSTQCIPNIAYKKDAWTIARKQLKHQSRVVVGDNTMMNDAPYAQTGSITGADSPANTVRPSAEISPTQTIETDAGFANDGDFSASTPAQSCAALGQDSNVQSIQSSSAADNGPMAWIVDLGKVNKIRGVFLHTYKGNAEQGSSFQDYMANVDHVTILVDSRELTDPNAVLFDRYSPSTNQSYVQSQSPSQSHSSSSPQSQSAAPLECGRLYRYNNALTRSPRLHVQCSRELEGRFVYVRVDPLQFPQRRRRGVLFFLCEVVVY